MAKHFPPTPDPSEEEIAAMCLEIQAGWSEAEFEVRRLRDVSGLNQTLPQVVTVATVSLWAMGIEAVGGGEE